MELKITGFLGRELTIPHDRSYDLTEGLWLKKNSNGSLAVGFTEPTVLMAGSIRQIEMLVEDGQSVSKGETVVLALTSKLKYVACPISGKIEFVQDVENIAQDVSSRPYETSVFNIAPEMDETLPDAKDYIEALKDSDGCRNPGGHKGGVSPTCKAVYMAIAEQNLPSE